MPPVPLLAEFCETVVLVRVRLANLLKIPPVFSAELLVMLLPVMVTLFPEPSLNRPPPLMAEFWNRVLSMIVRLLPESLEMPPPKRKPVAPREVFCDKVLLVIVTFPAF